MGGSRRRFSREFKLYAVSLVTEDGRQIGKVAQQLRLSRNLLQRWKSQLQASGSQAFPGSGRSNSADVKARRERRETVRILQEQELQAKVRHLLHEPVAVRLGFVRDHRGSFAVELMCATLHVSRSGFYAWLRREDSTRAREDRRLTELIRREHEGSGRVHGSPRIHAALRARGERCGRNRVANLMRRAGIRSGPERAARRREA
jgi:transposase-like protein